MKGVHARFAETENDYESRFITIGAGTSFEATVANLGATLVDLKVNGQSVVLGYPDGKGYKEGNCYVGATIGRYANRIAKGSYNLPDGAHRLSVNDGANTSHSSISSFHQKTFMGPLVDNPSKEIYTAEYLDYLDGEVADEGILRKAACVCQIYFECFGNILSILLTKLNCSKGKPPQLT